jgi:hypothetical protein
VKSTERPSPQELVITTTKDAATNMQIPERENKRTQSRRRHKIVRISEEVNMLNGPKGEALRP